LVAPPKTPTLEPTQISQRVKLLWVTLEA
jgi:hypothetical protein